MNRRAPLFRLLLVLPILALCFGFPSFAIAAPRTWTDASGKFKIEANLIGVEDGIVILERADIGKSVRIPFDKLSPADQKFLADNGAAPRTKTPSTSKPVTEPAEAPLNPTPTEQPTPEPSSPAAAATTPAAPPKVGEFRTEREEVPAPLFVDVNQRSNLQTKPEVLEQIRAGKVTGIREKNKPSWEIYVPETYLPDTPHGLFVFINAADTGNVPADWKPLLEKHKLIWVGANDSGNDHDTNWRHALALQGVREVQAAYTLDPDRIYISGSSGGGRAASLIMLMYADVFSGGFPHVGCNPYRELPLQDGKFLPGHPNLTTPQLFELAKKRNRYVFLTGDEDFNREQTQGVAQQYQADGFNFVTYLQVPKMGHAAPNGEWFEKGLVALDAPLAAQASAAFTKATGDAKRNKLGPALDGFRRAASHGGEQDFVPEAREKYLALQQQYQSELAALQAQIAAKEIGSISSKLATFRKQWAPASESDVQKMLEEIKGLRKK